MAESMNKSTSASQDASLEDGHHEGGHAPEHYVRIWAILVILLGLSIFGPEIGIQWLTLVTAFGIAVVKAYLVAKNFMHLNVEKRYVVYILLGAVSLMGVFYAGTAPDVMRHEGQHWNNLAAKEEVKRAQEEGSHADHSSDGASSAH